MTLDSKTVLRIHVSIAKNCLVFLSATILPRDASPPPLPPPAVPQRPPPLPGGGGRPSWPVQGRGRGPADEGVRDRTPGPQPPGEEERHVRQHDGGGERGLQEERNQRHPLSSWRRCRSWRGGRRARG